MIDKETLDDIAIYSAMHHNVLDNQVIILKKDLELLEDFLCIFERAILDATNPLYRRGDNIIADLLKDKLGLIKLNELREKIVKYGRTIN